MAKSRQPDAPKGKAQENPAFPRDEEWLREHGDPFSGDEAPSSPPSLGHKLKRRLRSLPVVGLPYRALAYWVHHGPRATLQRMLTPSPQRTLYARSFFISKARREAEAGAPPLDGTTFSLLVPLYNTPLRYLRQLLASVQGQTYENWELCLADASDASNQRVQRLCSRYAQGDARIVYQRLSENQGIAQNTNRCLEMATGQYIALLDHDDLLHPSALYQVAKRIRDTHADFLYTDEVAFQGNVRNLTFIHMKPDFAPDFLRAVNYICHLTVCKKTLADRLGGFRPELDGSQDHDFVLRATEQAERIEHIPMALYFWRSHRQSVAGSIDAKPYALAAGRQAVAQQLERLGLQGTVEDAALPGNYRIRYDITGQPLISILIPNKDHVSDLRRCIESIESLSTYRNYEILVLENNSQDPETFAYYQALEKAGKITLVRWEGSFNYSAINNLGAAQAKGDYLLLLNNDVKVITPQWMEEMLMFAQRADVGAVGAKLHFPDGAIQHAGVGVGVGGTAIHLHSRFPGNHVGYIGRLATAQNLSAVTGACLMVRKSVFQEVHGLDERFVVAFNDVDFCLRLREKGYLVVFTPYAHLYHYESISRGSDYSKENYNRFLGEARLLRSTWKTLLEKGDPYFNPNFHPDRPDFQVVSLDGTGLAMDFEKRYEDTKKANPL